MEVTMKKTCLIVDDSRVIRAVARRIIQELGFETIEAADGAQAIEACKKQMPQVMLLDWNMPVMDGPECLRLLRSMPGGDAPVVIFCTTENDVEHIRLAMEAGANEYIMKPFDNEIVQSKFAQLGLV